MRLGKKNYTEFFFLNHIPKSSTSPRQNHYTIMVALGSGHGVFNLAANRDIITLYTPFHVHRLALNIIIIDII